MIKLSVDYEIPHQIFDEDLHKLGLRTYVKDDDLMWHKDLEPLVNLIKFAYQ